MKAEFTAVEKQALKKHSKIVKAWGKAYRAEGKLFDKLENTVGFEAADKLLSSGFDTRAEQARKAEAKTIIKSRTYTCAEVMAMRQKAGLSPSLTT